MLNDWLEVKCYNTFHLSIHSVCLPADAFALHCVRPTSQPSDKYTICRPWNRQKIRGNIIFDYKRC